MKEIIILLGGDIKLTERLKQQVANKMVIAADGGIKHAKSLGIKVDLWVGDFDSTEEELLLEHIDVKREIFPKEKDKTDGQIAVQKAIQLGAKKIILVGVTGGNRFDHSLFHITYLLSLKKSYNIDIMGTDGEVEFYPLVPNEYKFHFPKDSLFSLITFSDVKALSIKGAYWDLTDRDVKFGDSITLSNKIISDLVINFKGGLQLLIIYLV
ncbi:thiamine diphosphokinase [Bartonella sp. DGB1]|uniref:thiamine diphosphokinase n=1 Tax=Bartonella sp. DGB1 TaxID=3239807 RepID=UPI0035255055